MTTRCIQCDEADLRPEPTVELQGTVRGEAFTVQMPGLVCPNCGYKTIEGADMPEFGRLLADKYRAAHGWLTSDEIRERREALRLNQQNWADFLKRGIASVKRWELGKIQDPANDRHIREMTDPRPASTMVYMANCSGYVNGTAQVVNTCGYGFTLASQPNSNQVHGCVFYNSGGPRNTTSDQDVLDLAANHSTSSKSSINRIIGRLAHA